jgi:hypothetical protein
MPGFSLCRLDSFQPFEHIAASMACFLMPVGRWS